VFNCHTSRPSFTHLLRPSARNDGRRLVWRRIHPEGEHSVGQSLVCHGCSTQVATPLTIHYRQIGHDPDNYPDPSSFRPERFLGENPELDPDTYVWGFGRRRCSGIELGKTYCLNIMANTLAVLDIVRAKDANGNEITPSGELFISSHIRFRFFPCPVHHRGWHFLARSKPNPFPYDTRVRSADAELLLEGIRKEYVVEPSDAHKLKF
jgi:hypothetical protein